MIDLAALHNVGGCVMLGLCTKDSVSTPSFLYYIYRHVKLLDVPGKS